MTSGVRLTITIEIERDAAPVLWTVPRPPSAFRLSLTPADLKAPRLAARVINP